MTKRDIKHKIQSFRDIDQVLKLSDRKKAGDEEALMDWVLYAFYRQLQRMKKKEKEILKTLTNLSNTIRIKYNG